MKRRAISFVTVLVLCLGLCPTQVLAADRIPADWDAANTPMVIASSPSPVGVTVPENTTVLGPYRITKLTLFDTCGYSYTATDEVTLRVTGTGGVYLTTGTIESQKAAGIEVQTGGFLCVDEQDMTVIGTTCGLDIYSGTNIESGTETEVRLSGGTFRATNPDGAAIRMDNNNFASLLVTGYAFFDKNGNTLRPENVSGLREVTVKKCAGHIGDAYTSTLEHPTHDGTCVYCGESFAKECEFDFDGISNSATCAVCGHRITITVEEDKLVYDGHEKPSSDAVKVELDGSTGLSEGTDYTVDYSSRDDDGEITVTVTGAGESWIYRKTFRDTRAAPEIRWGSLTAVSVPYSGSTVDKTVLPDVIITAANDDDKEDLEQNHLYFSYSTDGGVTYIDGLPTDAGAYQIKANLSATRNYRAKSSDPIDLEITKINPVETPPEAVAGLVYDRHAHELVTPGSVRPGAEIQFAPKQDGPWSKSIPTETDAGEYEVWYKVDETSNYNPVGPIQIHNVEIQQRSIRPNVKLDQTSYVYNNGTLEPPVTVTDPSDDNWVLPNTEYKVEYKNNQNVGTATATVSSAGKNYAFDAVLCEFTITPANQTGLTITGQPNKVEYGDEFTLGTSGGSGNETVTWKITAAKDAAGISIENEADFARVAKIDDPTSGQIKVMGLGWFAVQATKPGGTNLEDATAEVTFPVSPRQVTATVTAKSKIYDGTDKAEVTAKVVDQYYVSSGDTIVITGVTGTFSDANAGTNKEVTVNTEGAVFVVPVEKIGDNTYEKYVVTISTTPVRADITKAKTSVTAPNANSRTYDTQTKALVSAAAAAPTTDVDENGEAVVVEYALSESGLYSTEIPEAVRAGKYEVWYRVRGTDNYIGTTADKVDVTISPREVTAAITELIPNPEPAVGDNGSETYDEFYSYDGAEKRPAVTVEGTYTETGEGQSETITVTISPDEYDVTYSNNINVGKASGTNPPTVTVKAKENGNYTFKNEGGIATKTFTITTGGNKAVLTSSPLARDLTYDGTEQELVTVGTAAGGTLVYALASGYNTDGSPKPPANEIDYKPDIPKEKGAGTYTVYYKVRGDGNHEDSVVYSVSVTIKRLTVTSLVIKLEGEAEDGSYSVTYDSTPLTPKVVSVMHGDVTIPSTEYNVTYSNNINAGTATVHINDNDCGDYNVSGSRSFEITRAQAGFDPDPAEIGGLTYSAEAQPLITAGVPKGGTAVYWLEGGAHSAAVPTGTNRGTYKVHAMVQGDANHDNSNEITIEVTIGQNTVQAPTITVSKDQFTYDGATQRPDVIVKDDANRLIPDTEYDVVIKGKKDGNNSYSDVDTYDITIKTLEDENDPNYEPNYTFDEANSTKAGAYQIIPADQVAIAITGMPVQVYYGDKIQLSITGGTDEGEVKWEIKTKDGSETLNEFSLETNGLLIINEVGGPYFITAERKAASENYKTVSTTWGDFKTNRKPVTAVVTARDRDYNGTKDAELVSVTVPDTNITFTGYETYRGSFEDADVGSDKTVALPGLSAAVTVANDENYTISYPDKTTATIKPANVTVRGSGDPAASAEPKANRPDDKNLVYTGSPQDLLTEGAELTGGFWAYSTDGVSYGQDVPQRTDAGEYKVWYKVIPDRNHKYDVDPKSVTVWIDPAAQEELSIDGRPGAPIHYGDQFMLSVSGGSGDGEITWSSDDVEIDENSGAVKVTNVGNGLTITVKKGASANYKEGAAVTWSFDARPKQITAKVTADNKLYDGNNAADIHIGWEPGALVGDDTIDIDSVSGTFADKNVGTWTVTITHSITDERYEITFPDTTATISKTAARVSAPPQANPGPIRAGSDTPLLVTPGATAGGIGTVVYALENPYEEREEQDDTLYEDLDDYEDLDPDPPGLVYTEEIPTAASITKADTYTVWYKIEPTDNWAGTEPDSVTVTVLAAETPSGTSPGSTPSQATGTGSGSASSSSAASATGKPGTEEVSMQTSVRDRTASTVLDTAAGSRLVNEAVAGKSANVVIKPEITGDVTKTTVSIPASAVSRIVSETDAALTVSTPVADVTIPNASLGTLSSADSTVSVVTERIENTVVLTLNADGKDIGDILGGLTLTVPAEDAGPGTVAVLVHEDGTRETIRWSVAEDGVVRIPLSGSATVEIVDNSKEFVDVPAESWAADAVAFASAHELLNGTGGAAFSPELSMSRAMLATVLYNLEGCPDQELTGAFSDVSSDAWYAAGISWAAANGITSGYGDGQFGPNDNVTREQLAVMLWRYMESPASDKQVPDFMDTDQVSSYAMEALYWATANGILNGYGDGHLDPCGLATRAQAAQMLKNFIENT